MPQGRLMGCSEPESCYGWCVISKFDGHKFFASEGHSTSFVHVVFLHEFAGSSVDYNGLLFHLSAGNNTVTWAQKHYTNSIHENWLLPYTTVSLTKDCSPESCVCAIWICHFALAAESVVAPPSDIAHMDRASNRWENSTWAGAQPVWPIPVPPLPL